MAKKKEQSLKKLKRSELLEIMLAQSEEIDRLRAELAQKEAQLQERNTAVRQSGSIAEASLRLTNIFEEAQKAADLYLANVRGDELPSNESQKYEAPAQTRASAVAQARADAQTNNAATAGVAQARAASLQATAKLAAVNAEAAPVRKQVPQPTEPAYSPPSGPQASAPLTPEQAHAREEADRKRLFEIMGNMRR